MIFFNLCKCILISTLVKFNIYNDKLLKILIKNIYKCGVIPIKMIQWSLPYMKLINIDNKIINILENSYEKCPIHDIKFTNKIYKNDFYSDLDNDYKIIDIVGSGSIAQVYKIKSIKSDKLYAMKVKHPHADNNFNIIKLYLKIIFTLFSFNKLIPINLNDFLNQFEKQLNFINETNNLIKFNNLYKNNNLYKIPKLYKFSKNIIIMDYISGKSIETINTNIQYYKYNMIISIFMYNNLFINNFNHGDLHNYNWKITDDNKIVIYDFGLCWECNTDILDPLNDLFLGFNNNDNELIYKAFKSYFKNIEEKYIKEYFYKIPEKIDKFIIFSKYLILFSLKYNLLINIKILYTIITYQNSLLIFMNNFGNDSFDFHGIYKEQYNICDYYNTLPEYKKYVLKQLKIFNKNNNNINYDNLYKFIK